MLLECTTLSLPPLTLPWNACQGVKTVMQGCQMREELGGRQPGSEDVLFSPGVTELFHTGCRRDVQLCTWGSEWCPWVVISGKGSNGSFGLSDEQLPVFLQAVASHFLLCRGHPQ